MKLSCIFALFTLRVMVKGNLIAVAQPVLLTLGTLFTALNHDLIDKQRIDWRNFITFYTEDPEEKVEDSVEL